MSRNDRQVVFASATVNTTQTSPVIPNELYQGIDILFTITTILSTNLVLKVQAVTAAGATVDVFTGPAETTTGVKRYTIFPGAPSSTTEKNAFPPAQMKIVVTPTVPGNDVYAVEIAQYAD
jgi:hypothetical protein